METSHVGDNGLLGLGEADDRIGSQDVVSMFVMVDCADEMADVMQVGGGFQEQAVFRFEVVQRVGLVEDAPSKVGDMPGMPFVHGVLARQPLDGHPNLLAA